VTAELFEIADIGKTYIIIIRDKRILSVSSPKQEWSIRSMRFQFLDLENEVKT
jgi:hypothetical protein